MITFSNDRFKKEAINEFTSAYQQLQRNRSNFQHDHDVSNTAAQIDIGILSNKLMGMISSYKVTDNNYSTKRRNTVRKKEK